LKSRDRSPTARDIEITRAVLEGATLQSVGERHRLSRERVRVITNHVCRTTNAKLYKQVNWARDARLKWLRKQKAYFLTPAGLR
jgi:DNA-binding CsgD family transcriptional regulator